MISVVLLGAGNVATHLYKAFSKAENVTVVQWYNRTRSSIIAYANEVEVTDQLDEIKKANVYILAVSDDSIAKLSQDLPFTNRLIAHTSGSVAMHDLDKKNKISVFYPLQTFSKDTEIDITEVPICIEVYQKENRQILKDLAKAIGCKSHKISTEQRQNIHLAAVYVNNFTNQLYRIEKIQDLSPYMAQTGPAKRNDKKTIKRHLKQIESDEHKAIYELLTASIKKTHKYNLPLNKSQKKNLKNERR